MGRPGSPETQRAQTRDRTDGASATQYHAAWRRVGKTLQFRPVGTTTISTCAAADRHDALFHRAVADALRLGLGTAVPPCPAGGMPPIFGVADPPASALSLRQRLTEQGVAILGLIMQPKLICPDAPPLPAMPVEPDTPADDGPVSADQAERSAVGLLFGAKMAAARICLPKGVLAAELRSLHRERRACLQALHDRIAARRDVQAHERLARAFRRAAALAARGVSPRPVLERPEDTEARVKATILSKLGV